jgi:hypothetical protein
MKAHETPGSPRTGHADPQHCTHKRMLKDVESDRQCSGTVQCCECGAIIERQPVTESEPDS